MATLQASGTQTATVGTEHTLANVAVVGTFQLIVNTVNMASQDVLELRVKSVLLTGDTTAGEDIMIYLDAQATDQVIKRSIPYPNDLTDATSLQFTLKQTLGTGRSFKWKVLKL